VIKNIEESKILNNVFLIKLNYFEDFRGEYLEIYNKKEYSDVLKPFIGDVRFVEDDISTATKHVIKGIHGNNKTWKLISCLHGKIYVIVADPKTFKWQSFILSDTNKHQLLIPPKLGNGHMCLSEKSIYHYKQSTYYDLKNQFTIVWNDERYRFHWPMNNPIVSQRDMTGDKKHVHVEK